MLYIIWSVFYHVIYILDVSLEHSGECMTTIFSVSSIKSHILRTGATLLDHLMENISFASIGENVRV